MALVEPAIWIELLKAVPGVITAITAVAGVTIASRGLNRWHVETLGKRKAELAEQALIAAYEARDVFKWVRTGAFLDGEGNTRQSAADESEHERRQRNVYFVPIERLTRDKELFARLQTLQYPFAAYFGEPMRGPFLALREIHVLLVSAASMLIHITHGDKRQQGYEHSFAPLLNDLGWGASRPDDTDRKIDKAVADLEAVCRPVLMAKGERGSAQ